MRRRPPCSAAFVYHRIAASSSDRRASPSSYISARLYCAAASPCSAAFVYQRIAASSFRPPYLRLRRTSARDCIGHRGRPARRPCGTIRWPWRRPSPVAFAFVIHQAEIELRERIALFRGLCSTSAAPRHRRGRRRRHCRTSARRAAGPPHRPPPPAVGSSAKACRYSPLSKRAVPEARSASAGVATNRQAAIVGKRMAVSFGVGTPYQICGAKFHANRRDGWIGSPVVSHFECPTNIRDRQSPDVFVLAQGGLLGRGTLCQVL